MFSAWSVHSMTGSLFAVFFILSIVVCFSAFVTLLLRRIFGFAHAAEEISSTHEHEGRTSIRDAA